MKIAVDATLTELYRAEFEGGVPEIDVNGGTVTIGHKRHFLPFDWRVAKSEIWLNPAVPWEVSLKGGMWKLAADFRGLELRSLEVGGGASDVEIWLPAPAGVVPVRISGGASHVRLHRPAGSALRAEVTGGASQLVFDRKSLGSIGGRNRLETPGFAGRERPLRGAPERRRERARHRHRLRHFVRRWRAALARGAGVRCWCPVLVRGAGGAGGRRGRCGANAPSPSVVVRRQRQLEGDRRAAARRARRRDHAPVALDDPARDGQAQAAAAAVA